MWPLYVYCFDPEPKNDVTRRSNSWKRVLVAAVALAGAAAAACARSAPAAQQAPVDARALFAQACAKCHAADGSGGLPMVANGPKPIDLRDAGWQRSRTDNEIALAIRDGRGAMPPFAGVLAEQQIAGLARHVRSLAKP